MKQQHWYGTIISKEPYQGEQSEKSIHTKAKVTWTILPHDNDIPTPFNYNFIIHISHLVPHLVPRHLAEQTRTCQRMLSLHRSKTISK